MRKSFCSICSIILLSFILFTTNVSAKSIYYINDKGVSFTEEEYNFLSYMFWDGSQDLMNQDDYNRFIESDIMHGELDKKVMNYDDGIMPIDNTREEDRARILTIAKSCASNCLVSITLNWKGIPTIKKYDVIGAIFTDTSFVTSPTTTVNYVGTTNLFDSNMQKFSNGFGVSVELPSSAESLNVNTYFRVKPGGHVYGSYQHAMETISLANSKKYTLSRAGYGSVFDFYGPAIEIYDKMPGVDISL